MYTKPERMHEAITIPEGITVTQNKHMLGFTGPLGKTFKSFRSINVKIRVDNGQILLDAAGPRKRDYATLHTARSILRNICEGLVTGYTVRMKVVFAHFPVTVKVSGRQVIIENFQGERAPRTTRIVGNTRVIPKGGDEVVVTGAVLTDVTQTAANIELATKIKNKDHRVFLDGIYVYKKDKGIDEGEG